MGSPLNPSLRKFTWRIENFSRLTERKCESDDFTIGGCKWRLQVYPKGATTDHVSCYLIVAYSGALPTGWCREAYFSLTMVNQIKASASTKQEFHRTFNAQCPGWGYASFEPLKYLQDCPNGFLVEDTVILEVEIDVRSVVPPIVIPEADHSSSNTVPPVVTETKCFGSFFNQIEEFIITAENSASKDGSVSYISKNDQLFSRCISTSPSLKEVEKAKESLKICLSGLFKLDMKDRLSTALSTLIHAKVGLSSDQQRSIQAFRENFDDFVADFLMFEQDNAELELQRLARDKMLSAIKKKHETRLSNKKLLDDVTAEEEELKRRMEEANTRKRKLISDWENLVTETDEAISKYMAQEKKFAMAKVKRGISEVRMYRSSSAWASLKAHFVSNS